MAKIERVRKPKIRQPPSQAKEVRELAKAAQLAVARASMTAVEKLTELVVEEGHVGAANLLLSRCMPAVMAQIAPTNLRIMFEERGCTIEDMTLADRADMIAVLAMEGEISPTAAQGMLNVIESTIGIRTMLEVVPRLEELERLAKAKTVR